MATAPKLINASAYAKLRGVSKMAVSRAVASGRISTTTDEAGKRWIDPAVADVEWAKNTDLKAQTQGAPDQISKTQARAAAARAKTVDRRGDKNAPTSSEVPKTTDLGLGLNLTDERTRFERLRIEKAEMELAAARGETVNRGAVEAAWSAKLLQASEQLQGIPDRLAAVLAAELNANEVHRLLTAEIRAAMSALSVAPVR